MALGALVAVLALGTPESALAEDRVDFDQLVPVRFRYAEIYHRKPPSLSLRRNESRAVQPPTQYRTSSILQYSRPLGNTGMLLKVKAPLNPRKIIKIEIKF